MEKQHDMERAEALSFLKSGGVLLGVAGTCFLVGLPVGGLVGGHKCGDQVRRIALKTFEEAPRAKLEQDLDVFMSGVAEPLVEAARAYRDEVAGTVPILQAQGVLTTNTADFKSALTRVITLAEGLNQTGGVAAAMVDGPAAFVDFMDTGTQMMASLEDLENANAGEPIDVRMQRVNTAFQALDDRANGVEAELQRLRTDQDFGQWSAQDVARMEQELTANLQEASWNCR